MHHEAGARWNLVVVERREDVLRIAAVDAVAVLVEHVDIDEVRPRIDFVVLAESAVAGNDLAAARGLHVHPDFIRVHRALREQVGHAQRAQNDLDEIGLAGLERRHLRTQRCGERAVDGAAFFHAEDVQAQRAFAELFMLRDDLLVATHMRQGGVRRGKKMIVDEALGLIRRVEKVRPEILRRDQRHVTVIAILLSLGREIERACAVARATEHERIVVILAAQPFLVVIHRERNADLVAGRTELLGLHHILHEHPLVELRLGLHELVVDVLQGLVGRVRERVMNRLGDGEVRVADGAVHRRDRVAGRASDARFGGRVVVNVEVRIIERAAEERHRVMAAGAPA